jgi:hypothetical protein
MAVGCREWPSNSRSESSDDIAANCCCCDFVPEEEGDVAAIAYMYVPGGSDKDEDAVVWRVCMCERVCSMLAA